jgi:hypothetical protein
LDTPSNGELGDMVASEKLTLANQLATILKASKTGDAIKVLDWVIDLSRNATLQVDNADLDWIIKFIEDNKEIWNLLKGQLLRELKTAKDTKNGKKTD